MFGIAAIVSFVLSLLFNVWAISHGHIGWQTFAILGLLFLTIHIVTGDWRPWKHA